MNLTKRTGEPGTLETLRREMDHFFDDLVPFSLHHDNGGKALATWAPSADITEDENEYLLHLDIPGMEKKDIKVNFQDGRITITGERKMEEKVEKKDQIRRERYQGKFYRSFTLPEKIKEESIQASFNNGVLKLVIPKTEAKKPKEIKIS
jgi:HSP20 family protein